MRVVWVFLLLLLAGCTAVFEPENGLSGTEWQLVRYGTLGEIETAVPVIQFTAVFNDTTLQGHTGCNDYAYSYTLRRQNQISLTDVTELETDCPGSLLRQQETALNNILRQATTFTIENGLLTLGNGEETAVFQPLTSPEPNPPLTNFYYIDWQLVALENNNGPLPTDNITIHFTPEEATGFSGCNSYTIPLFIIEPANIIQLENISQTFESCDFATTEQERAYFALLTTTEAFQQEENTLILYSPHGTLFFVK